MQKFSNVSNQRFVNSQATTKMNFKLKNTENLKTQIPQTKGCYQSKSKFPDQIQTENQKPHAAAAARKSHIPKTFVNTRKTMPVNKIVLSEKPYSKKSITKSRNPLTAGEQFISPGGLSETKEISEVYVQTNESEILNHLLIVGDCRVMAPSRSVVNEIEKLRSEKEAKLHTAMIKSTRKFEKHSEKQEQHLDDLNEFLEKRYISKKPTSNFLGDTFEDDCKIIESMDELLQRESPKIESITDIRSRIKQKEQELLKLFNHYTTKKDVFGPASN